MKGQPRARVARTQRVCTVIMLYYHKPRQMCKRQKVLFIKVITNVCRQLHDFLCLRHDYH